MDLNKTPTLEELRSRFPEIDAAMYGPCVVVPGDEFNPDWEPHLADQGHLCHEMVFKGKPVTLVELTKKGEPIPSASGPPPATRASSSAESSKTSSQTSSGKDWTVEEDKVLVEKWKEGNLTIREIQEQCFPTRSKESVGMHIWDLQQRGIIQKKQVKGGRPKGTKNKPEAKQKELKKNTDHSDESKVPFIGTEELLKEILDCLRGFEPVTFSFEHHCRKCGTSGFAGDEPEVWRVCPRCGEPLIVWNVQSLEASE